MLRFIVPNQVHGYTVQFNIIRVHLKEFESVIKINIRYSKIIFMTINNIFRNIVSL